MHNHHLLRDVGLAGAAGLGGYELWHHHQYGDFGFGNPYNQGFGNGGYGGYGSPYGYGAPGGFGSGFGGGYGSYY
jgi:hypothetical protein